ncbi:MAG: hypothetical protein M1831_007486 [Alyxoria varia]|nr:MAG: hypothetical protein M1831_007486 [Alyxoria varia]
MSQSGALSGGSLPPDEDIGYPGLVLINFIPVSLATVAVIVRLYMRLFIKGVAGWDDASMVVAAILAFAYAGGVSAQVHYGFGRHVYYKQPFQLIAIAKLNTAVNILNAAALFFARSSIALFLLRMTKSASNKYRTTAIWVAFALNIAVAIATIVPFAVICVPLRAFWDKTVEDYFCFDPTVFNRLWRGVTGMLAPFYYWAALEIHLAILFGSFPVVRQFFSHVRNTHSIYPTTIPLLPTSTSSRILEKTRASKATSGQGSSGKSTIGSSNRGGGDSVVGTASKTGGEGGGGGGPANTTQRATTQSKEGGAEGFRSAHQQPMYSRWFNPLRRWKQRNNITDTLPTAEPEAAQNNWIKLSESTSASSHEDTGCLKAGGGHLRSDSGRTDEQHPRLPVAPSTHDHQHQRRQDGRQNGRDSHSGSRRNLLAAAAGPDHNVGSSRHVNDGATYRNGNEDDYDGDDGTAGGNGDMQTDFRLHSGDIGRRDSITVMYEQPPKKPPTTFLRDNSGNSAQRQ